MLINSSKYLTLKELSIGNKVSVLIYLTKFSPYRSTRSCILYVPRNGLFPENLDVADFIKRGIPYLYICDDFVEAYAGIFRPERIFYLIHSASSVQNKLKILISDDIFYIIKSLRESIIVDEEALASFLELGRTVGEHTLIEHIKLLDAGFILRIDENRVKLDLGFRYGETSVLTKSIEDLNDEFVNIIFNVFREYIDVAKRENAILTVPLSAGIDSRFVLSVINILGYRDVVTVTYGLRESEYPVARRIAETLGYENIFIEYTWDLWRNYIKDMWNYMVWASQFVTTPNIQEYITVRELLRLCSQDKIKCEKILMVTGDISNVVAGKDPYPPELLRVRSIEGLVDFITNKNTLFSDFPKRKERMLLKGSLLKFFYKTINWYEGKIDITTMYEVFHWKDRHFKYISSVRLPYVYYGLRYITPLWDGRIVKFLSSIPWPLRYKLNLYNRVLKENFFKVLGVDFDDPTKSSKTKLIPDLLADYLRYLKLFGFKKLPMYILRGRESKNPCGFDVYFPRMFTITYATIAKKVSKDRELKMDSNVKPFVVTIKTYLKAIPQDIIAFNTLTTFLLLNETLMYGPLMGGDFNEINLT